MTHAIFISYCQEDAAYCQEFVQALQTADVDVWWEECDQQSSGLTDAIKQQVQQRPIFIVLLSPSAFAATQMHDACRWAYRRYQQHHQRIMLAVTAQPFAEDIAQALPYLQPFRRIESVDHQPSAPAEAARRVKQLLDNAQLDRAPATTPTPTATLDELLQQGHALLKLGRRDAALDVFQHAVTHYPTVGAAWVGQGDTLRQLDRHVEATAAYDHALALNPSDTTAGKKRGEVLAMRGLYGLALAAYERVLALAPNDAAGWEGRGDALFAMRQYELALATYEHALSLSPHGRDAWNKRGNTLIKLQRYAELLTICERVLAQHPDEAAWQMRGRALLGLQRYDELLAITDSALAHDVNNSVAWRQRASALRALGRATEAQEAETKANILER